MNWYIAIHQKKYCVAIYSKLIKFWYTLNTSHIWVNHLRGYFNWSLTLRVWKTTLNVLNEECSDFMLRLQKQAANRSINVQWSVSKILFLWLTIKIYATRQAHIPWSGWEAEPPQLFSDFRRLRTKNCSLSSFTWNFQHH